jgi:cellulose synthase (UDP-forming)
VKASVIGLFGSRNQKFKVTAKGASRLHTVVHWSLIRWFAPLTALTAGGIALRAFGGAPADGDADLEVITVFWSFYNIAVMLLAIGICVERPRPRGQERFVIDEPASILLPNGAVAARLVDASLEGAMFALRAPADLALGTRVFVEISMVGAVPARVVRLSDRQCSVRFDLTHAEEIAMIRKLFSGKYSRPLITLDPVRFIRLLAARALG